MKTKRKNKLLTAIVLCTLFLVALPGIAAAQEDDTLDIYGNANEDDTIDMRDFTYTARMILWLEDETTLADANYDGDVNVLDMTQIGLIILGRESKLTLVDSADRIVTVNKPVERISFSYIGTAEMIKIVGAWDSVVTVDYNARDELLFPGASELPLIDGPASIYDLHFEVVFEADPDIFLTAVVPMPGFEEMVATLEPEIPVVALDFLEPHTVVENVRKLRYVLNTEESGEAFIAWYEGVINDITEETAGLSEDEKPRVFLKIPGMFPDQLCTFTNGMGFVKHMFEVSGAINIAADLPAPGGWVQNLDQEWLVDQNPEVIIASVYDPYHPDVFGYDVDDPSAAKALRNEIMGVTAFEGSDAVANGEVYLFENQFLMGSARVIVGIAYWAKWFHPDLCVDLDPKAIHQEYLTDFMRIDYDLDEHGVFVYPEP